MFTFLILRVRRNTETTAFTKEEGMTLRMDIFYPLLLCFDKKFEISLTMAICVRKCLR